ncbi:hypothetical protein MMC30_002794 [Trapelia coarctata]|nr:hypothetical protein [Trapelia coarctata]
MEPRESIDIQLPIQVHTRPATPVERDEIYNMQVLSLDFGRTEQDLDRQFLVTALNLGIDVPQDPKPSLHLATSNFSALTLSSNPKEPSSILSRTSESTNPTSCSSSQQQFSITKASSQTSSPAPSKPASVFSSASRSTPYTKIRKGLHRLSSLTRRRTISSNTIPTLVQPGSIMEVIQTEQRPATADAVIPASFASMRSDVIQTSTSLPEQRSLARYRPMTPPVEEKEAEEDMWAARERSMKNRRLQKLRAHQIEEQGRFLRFEEEQRRLIDLKRTEARRSIADGYQTKNRDLQERHIEVMADFEHRHLSAEMDLSRALQLERKACETRLRHMEAYCNGRTDGMPRRKVTDEDFKKLLNQQHTLSSMENLHEARINVLREKQGKQLERIQTKQQAELKLAKDETDIELERHEKELTNEEEDLRQDFQERKRRIMSRWKLAEAIERQKLDNETGEAHAPLPPIEWPEEVAAEVQERPMLGKQAFWKAAVMITPVGNGSGGVI